MFKKLKNNTALSILCYIVMIVFVSVLITQFVTQRVVVDGESMEPTFQDGDNLFVNKLIYRFQGIERFDVIVFHDPNDKSSHLIKRVIGLPGETVRITPRGVIMLNDEPLVETYGKEAIIDPGLAMYTIELEQDEYFVLGDNRNHSADSRNPAIGAISKNDIVGRIELRIYPLSDIGVIK